MGCPSPRSRTCSSCTSSRAALRRGSCMRSSSASGKQQARHGQRAKTTSGCLWHDEEGDGDGVTFIQRGENKRRAISNPHKQPASCWRPGSTFAPLRRPSPALSTEQTPRTPSQACTRHACTVYAGARAESHRADGLPHSSGHCPHHPPPARRRRRHGFPPGRKLHPHGAGSCAVLRRVAPA